MRVHGLTSPSRSSDSVRFTTRERRRIALIHLATTLIGVVFEMRIQDIFANSQFGLSFEIFPPKTSEGDASLDRALERLANYQPSFISCTYGAGGSTQSRTLDWCVKIQQRFGLTATSHFTCVGSTRVQLVDWLQAATDRGIGNIMALRGDAPQGQESFEAVEGGLSHANELVELIREHFPNLGIGVAGYPEKHQEAPSLEIDIQNLKRKVDAGADAIFTQLFYVNDNYRKFVDLCRAAGITIPIIPGIMPITNFKRIQRITQMCGAVFPTELSSKLEAHQDDDEAQFRIGVDHAIGQCRELIDEGAAGMHFYVLNRSQACEEILNALDLRPPQAECA